MKNKLNRKVFKHLRGTFLPKSVNNDPIIADINNSLKKLEYYDSKCDKMNIRQDIASLNRDFNKSIRESKAQFNLSL